MCPTRNLFAFSNDNWFTYSARLHDGETARTQGFFSHDPPAETCFALFPQFTEFSASDDRPAHAKCFALFPQFAQFSSRTILRIVRILRMGSHSPSDAHNADTGE